MAKASTDLLEMILRECARAESQPWYPSTYVQETGLSREELDASLDDLRLGGLIRLTDWVQGRGQGYVLTPEGKAVVDSPRLLERVRSNGVPARPTPTTTRQRAEERPTTWDRGEDVRAALIGRTTPRVTLVLLFLNLLVFAYGLAMAVRNQISVNDFVAGTSPAVLEISHQTGALRPEDLIIREEWWRLITCCFVHFGLLHLGVNMFSLYVIGPLVERMWGSWGFLVLYVLSGLVGSCTMMVFSAFHDGAGASGALWGIMASVAAWVFLNRHYLPRSLVSAWSRQLLIVFVVNVLISNMPGVSAAAHFGGGIAGLVLAVPLHYVRRARGLLRWLAVAGIMLVPVVAVAAVDYKVGLHREQVNEERAVNEKYLPKLTNTLGAEIKVYRIDHIPQLLAIKSTVERRNKADDAQIPAKVRELQKKLKDTTNLFSTADAFHEPALEEFMQAAKKYLAVASRFYQGLQTCLDDQSNWSINKDEQLVELNRQLVIARTEVEKLFRHPAQ